MGSGRLWRMVMEDGYGGWCVCSERGGEERWKVGE